MERIHLSWYGLMISTGRTKIKKISTERFAIVGKNKKYLKPFIDDTPYLLFKTKKDAEMCMVMEPPNSYNIIKVQVTIEPVRAL